MSFGWSAGDIATAVELLIKVAVALNNSRGSVAKYQETSSYLVSLAAILEQLKGFAGDLVTIQEDVQAVSVAVGDFLKVHSRFERSLSDVGPKDWVSSLRKSPRKVQYAFTMESQVAELRNRIDTPLKSISLALGLEVHKESRMAHQMGLETQKLVLHLKDSLPGLSAEILTGFEDILRKDNAQHSSDEVVKKYRDAVEWLKPIPVVDTYRAILGGMEDGSCLWFFNKEEFSSWKDSVKSDKCYPILWITGIAGAGKTRLATRVIQRLQEDHEVGYFYCDTKHDERRTVLSILRTWAGQMLRNDSSQLSKIIDLRAKEPIPNETNMEKALHCVIEDQNEPIFILDGIDECEEVIRKKLYPILAQLATRAKIMVVSREMSELTKTLRGMIPKDDILHYRIIENDNESDICQFLERKVKEVDIGDDEVEQKVISALRSGAHGMFLWAALMIEEISRPRFFAEEYLEALQDLPENLDALYEQLLLTLNSNIKTKSTTWQLLKWLVCARRPLTLHEISSALRIKIDEKRLHTGNRMPDERLKETVLRYCGSLVAIHDSPIGSSAVTLVHASLKDFLLNDRGNATYRNLTVDAGESHMMIAQACLTYLCYENINSDPCFMNGQEGERGFEVGRSEMEKRFDSYVDQYPFLEYAALNWWLHFTAGSKNPNSYNSLECFCKSEAKTISWLQIVLRYRGDRGRWGSSPGAEDLRGLLDLGEILSMEHQPGFRRWLEPFMRPENSRSILTRWQHFLYCGAAHDFLPKLQIAAFFDYGEYLEQCLSNGANPDQRNHVAQTALFLAADGDSINTARALVKFGANVNAIGWQCGTPLGVAIRLGGWWNTNPVPYTVAEFLLESGANPCYNDGEYLSLACRCAFPNDPYCVDLISSLLKHGAAKFINAGIFPAAQLDVPPIHWAVRRRCPAVVGLLLANHAAVDIRASGDIVNESKIDTPLIQACSVLGQLEQVIHTLLGAGASVKARRHDGRTALHLSSRQSRGIAKMLLDADVDVNAISADGSLALHDAVSNENLVLMEMLIAQGSALDFKDGAGRTPLMIAVEMNTSISINAIEMLVNAGAHLESDDWVVERLNQKGIQLRLKKNMDQYWPQQPRNVFEVFWLLRYHASSKGLPPNVTIRILDLSKYWLKSTTSRKQHIAFDEEAAKRIGKYLTSKPIRGRLRAPVREVRFTIESHDQGWSSFPEFHGTFAHSWTWFEVAVQKQGDRIFDFGDESQMLTPNLHAITKSSRHRIIYECSPCTTVHRKWLKNLEAGDQISISAKARYPGWVNFVEGASIEIFTTCLVDQDGSLAE